MNGVEIIAQARRFAVRAREGRSITRITEFQRIRIIDINVADYS